MTLKLFHRNLNKELYVTLVYAKCDAIERIDLWDSMYHLASDMESSWLIGGDFNVILSEEEKYRGRPVYLRKVEDFAHCVDTCALYDLGFKGSLYTWWNERSDIDCIFKRLDRAKLHKVEADLTRYYHLEEEFWRQKAGIQWFKDGDRNTMLFHAHVRGKRKRLQVSGILDKNDNLLESQEDMAREALEFFQAQFTEERIPTNFDII
ncbi:uncharacterized protein LOC142180116 [Nicotiana tabacum]|uniref:Uncharacterized protein LOC142180116 n=1 Tax=Nicotiana tabacum TaxID=4097 RepID=A0AC58UCC8_TOBAC